MGKKEELQELISQKRAEYDSLLETKYRMKSSNNKCMHRETE